MNYTDQNGIYYSFDKEKSTATADLTKYNGQDNFEIPKYIKYEDHEYAIIGIKSTVYSGYKFKSIDFADGSLVTNISNIRTEKIKIPPYVNWLDRNSFDSSILQSIEFQNGSKLKSISFHNIFKNITKIVIPSNVEKIVGYNSNRFLLNLQTVEFDPNSRLQSIGNNAFFRSKIQSISIPSSVKEIGERAFIFCGQLQTVEFPNNSELKKIGPCAFSGTNIRHIKIPFKVENLDEGFFFGANQLVSIDVDSDNEHYSSIDGLFIHNNEELIFANRNLSTISIPLNIKKISKKAFEKCLCIKTIEIPDKSDLETIEDEAFAESSIEKVVLPFRLTKIKNGAFKNCKGLQIIEFPPNSELRLIGNSVFQSSGIIDIEIPQYVIQIGDNVFDSCTNLQSIKFNGNQLRSIGNYSFQSSSLSKIVIPSSVQQIGKYAFNKCDKLQFVEFSDDSNLRYIEEGSFNSLTQLETIKIPSKVCQIGLKAFENCSKLKKVEFSKNSELCLIDDFAFKCTSIESISIPSLVKRIGVSAFESSGINSIEFRENSQLILIDKSAFNNCRFKQIKIPPSVQKIDDSAFYFCSNLESFDLDENSQLKSLGNRVFYYSKIKSIMIPSHVDEIGNKCFESVDNLETIEISKDNELFAYINNGLLLTKKDAKSSSFDVLIFVRYGLDKVIIPPYVKYISMNAFISHPSYIEISKGTQIDFVYRDEFTSYSSTIVAPMSFINLPSFFGYYERVNRIGILDDDVKIDRFTFCGFSNISEISLPNAKNIRIENGCPKMSLIVHTDANISGYELNVHKIRRVPSRLLEEDRFPSQEKEHDFLIKNCNFK